VDWFSPRTKEYAAWDSEEKAVENCKAWPECAGILKVNWETERWLAMDTNAVQSLGPKTESTQWEDGIHAYRKIEYGTDVQAEYNFARPHHEDQKYDAKWEDDTIHGPKCIEDACGVCGGNATSNVTDACGVCGGTGTTEIDSCGVCGGEGRTCHTLDTSLDCAVFTGQGSCKENGCFWHFTERVATKGDDFIYLGACLASRCVVYDDDLKSCRHNHCAFSVGEFGGDAYCHSVLPLDYGFVPEPENYIGENDY